MMTSDLKYMTIYRTLKHRIAEGRYKVGELFPTEPELQREFGASRITVRRSVQMLVDEGFLQRMPGVGTVVLSSKGSLQLNSLVSFAKENQSKSLSSEIVRYRAVLAPKPIVLYRLGLSANDTVAYQERIRYVDGEPVGFQRIHVPSFMGLDEDVLSNRSISLYELFEEKGHKVLDAEETIEAVSADDILSGYLRIEVGSPLLYVQRTTRDQGERVVEYAEIYYRGDSYQYSAKLRAAN